MVTTRSADKRNRIDTKSENLALRSKMEESSPVPRPVADRSSSSSLQSKSKIVMDVPMPGKCAKLSQTDIDDTDVNLKPTQKDVPQATSGQMQSAKDEIPDSQESPSKQDFTEGIKSQSDYVAFEEDNSPTKARLGPGRKRKASGLTPSRSQSSATHKSTAVATGKHQRFGSEDRPEDGLRAKMVNENMQGQGSTSEAVSADDDNDDAPEEETIRPASAQHTGRTKRKARVARSLVEQQGLRSSANNGSAKNKVPAEVSESHEDVPETLVTPSNHTNRLREGNDATELASDDAHDTAFVTARTHRHLDVFTTPQSHALQTISPRSSPVKNADGEQIANKAADLSFGDRAKSTATKTALASSPKAATSSSISNTGPAKAGNSLERYRQQLQKNRLARKVVTGRGPRFRLQEEWRNKRSRFIVGDEIMTL